MEKFNRVKAQINLDNFLDNVALMHEDMPNVPLICVIKADGYGHGAYYLAKELEDLPYVWGYAVACADEGVRLRKQGIKKNILILGYTFEDQYEILLDNDIRATIFTVEDAIKLSRFAEKKKRTCAIHIKLDTGMNRIGFRLDEDYVDAIKKIYELPCLYIEGCFTHFYRSDEADKSIAQMQYAKYTNAIDCIKAAGVDIKMCHCSNSAAIMELKEYDLDAARAGISIYGLWPSDEMDRAKNELKPVMSIISHISHIKTINKGETIGYGGTFEANKEMRIATVPVGYADGYARTLSNKACVLIKGKRAPIVGRICMDQFMVDVTDIDNVAVTDEVVLLGKSGDESISMEELGTISGRFNYEFACDINPRVPREYIKGGKIIAQTSNLNTCHYFP